MIRSMVAVLALAIGTTAAAAQSCDATVKERQALMKRSGDNAKLGASMVRGDAPFDMAKVNQIYGVLADKADKLLTLFPDCSKTGADTAAAPAIWQKPDDFKAAVAKFSTDVKTAQANTKDIDSFKANFGAVGRDCGACHETFRIKKN